MQFYKETAVQGPLNYAGGKFELLPQIFPYFPKKVSTFLDVFAGGWNVGINVNADTIIFNDINTNLVSMLKALMCYSLPELLSKIDMLCTTYNLIGAGQGLTDKQRFINNQKGFDALKNLYNKKGSRFYRDPIVLYVLVGFSFQNQVKINPNGDFTNSVGTGLSMALRDKLINFVTELHNRHDRVLVSNLKFQDIDLSDPAMKNVFLYVDPPYLITNASYNKIWNDNTEREFLAWLDEADARGLKFALSNLLSRDIQRKGETSFTSEVNTILDQWIKNNKHRYTMYNIQHSYGNIAVSVGNKLQNEKEILVVNYEPDNLEAAEPHPSQYPHPMGVGYVQMPRKPLTPLSAFKKK